MKKTKNTPVAQTESQLKEEAKQQALRQAEQAALRPTSPWRKQWDNYWYHYKWPTLAGVLALVMAVVFVQDVLLRTRPDATLVIAASQPISSDAEDALQAILEHVAGDFNGDGKVSIQLNSILLPSDDSDSPADPQLSYAGTMKLTTVVAGGSDLLYLLDDELYDHLTQMAGESGGMFLPLNGIPSADGDRLPLPADLVAKFPELAGMCFSIRTPSAEKEQAFVEYCWGMLDSLSV